MPIEYFAHVPEVPLTGYSDSSYADCEDRKSTAGYLFKLFGGTICHRSFKERLVTTSTTEAEYVAITYAAKEAAWLCRLCAELGMSRKLLQPLKLYVDNLPARLSNHTPYAIRAYMVYGVWFILVW